jgi:hypothetical protein
LSGGWPPKSRRITFRTHNFDYQYCICQASELEIIITQKTTLVTYQENIMIDPALLFNLTNLIYWLILIAVIVIETASVSHWPENARWLLGYLTLFGTSLLLMVNHAGWHYPTWLLLLLLAGLFRLLYVDYYALRLIGRFTGLDLAGVWAGPKREPHRWTAQYFAAFVAAIPCTLWAGADVVTWAAMFFSLGLCGGVKVGYHATFTSYHAARLRRQSIDQEDC